MIFKFIEAYSSEDFNEKYFLIIFTSPEVSSLAPSPKTIALVVPQPSSGIIVKPYSFLVLLPIIVEVLIIEEATSPSNNPFLAYKNPSRFT